MHFNWLKFRIGNFIKYRIHVRRQIIYRYCWVEYQGHTLEKVNSIYPKISSFSSKGKWRLLQSRMGQKFKVYLGVISWFVEFFPPRDREDNSCWWPSQSLRQKISEKLFCTSNGTHFTSWNREGEKVCTQQERQQERRCRKPFLLTQPE